MKARPYPLYCPIPSRAPAIAACGSPVSSPSGVNAQSRGMGRPSAACQFIMPLPAVVSAMSRTAGNPSPVGTAIPHGFVPTAPSRAPQGAISGPALVKAIPIQPTSGARHAWTALEPKCVESRTTTCPIPHTFAFSRASRMARVAATVPIPLWASMSARAGLSFRISQRALGSM